MGERQPAVDGMVDHLFRRHAGELVALLARIFGPSAIDLAEDVVQEAFMQAMRRWPYEGPPDVPLAWLTRVARNRALDRVRRDRRWQDRRDSVERHIVAAFEAAARADAGYASEIADDQLRLVFACCHHEISRESRVALTLRTVGGFSTDEIARAFLAKRETIAQRLVRAKRRLREAPSLALPEQGHLAERSDAVLESLYLMFNEGYASFAGEDLIRQDLCGEAIRLVELMADHAVVSAPQVDALAALFLFQAARLPARRDAGGDLMLLHEQDRSLWHGELIRRGLERLRRSARGEEETSFHIQAEIASCHTLSKSAESTDWARILALYDRLRRIAPSPVVEINRAVAVLEVRGGDEALAVLLPLVAEGAPSAAAMSRYYPFWAVLAESRQRVGQNEAARADLEMARSLVESPPILRYLERRLERVGSEP